MEFNGFYGVCNWANTVPFILKREICKSEQNDFPTQCLNYQMKKWATSCLQTLLNKGFFEIAIKGYKYEKNVLLFSVLPNVWLARSPNWPNCLTIGGLKFNHIAVTLLVRKVQNRNTVWTQRTQPWTATVSGHFILCIFSLPKFRPILSLANWPYLVT